MKRSKFRALFSPLAWAGAGILLVLVLALVITRLLPHFEAGHPLPGGIASPTPTTVPTSTHDLSAYYGETAPAAILILGEEKQTAGVGTSTWTVEKKGKQVKTQHSDAFGLVTPAKPLSVTSPFTATLLLPIPVAPSRLEYGIKPASSDLQYGDASQEFINWQVPIENPGISLPLVMQQDIAFSLVPGGYLLEVYAEWPDLGGVDYGFLLEVQNTGDANPASPTTTPIPPTIMPVPAANQTILTIRNDQPFSGVAGDPKPDWLGWGAQSFCMSPQGDFWLLDSAAQPQRLLHLVPPYDTPQIISLEGLVGAADVECAQDAIWVLGIASQPPRLVKLALDGATLASYDLPVGLRPENGLTGIALAQDGAPLIELEGGTKFYQLLDPSGGISPQLLEGATFGGRLYRIEAPSLGKTGVIYAGDVKVEVTVEGRLGGLRVLGAAPDGSFYLEVYEMYEGPTISGQWHIRRYSATGELLGTVDPLPSAISGGQDLVVGLDGLVYQLASNPDHSVQIVRLGFQLEGPLQPEASPVPTGTPTPLPPLLPTWTATPVDATDLDKARYTLLSFFTLLHEGRYAEAASLYGGPYDGIRENNPDISADDYAQLWQAVCTRQTVCMLVADIVAEKLVNQETYEFQVEFIWRDGTLFKFGPCCGATEAEMPPVWQFHYTVQKVNGEFRVMEGPVMLP
jgi:hypothetical protein